MVFVANSDLKYQLHMSEWNFELKGEVHNWALHTYLQHLPQCLLTIVA